MSEPLPDVEFLYAEWKRLHCGQRDLIQLLRLRPRWKVYLRVPWLWCSHYATARTYTTRLRSAMLATLFSRAFVQMSSIASRNANA
jgi:hypothetical protein